MISSGPSTYWFPRWTASKHPVPQRANTSEVLPEQAVKNLQQKPSSTHPVEPSKGKAIAELDRATHYLNAVRELKEVPVHQKHSGAHEVYLDIAHYEPQPGLVDLYA